MSLSPPERGLLGLGLIVAAACGAPPQSGPVPLEGSRADLSTIAGTWAGRYWSEATGRHGTITFELRAGADTAHGEVEMTFSPALRLYGQQPRAPDDLSGQRTPCTAIDIAIVRVQGRHIRGTLAPYWDPDCDCRTVTVFDGDLDEQHIAGTFTSRRETSSGPEVTGSWFVDRRD